MPLRLILPDIDHEGGLVAIRKLDAIEAVGPDFVRQFLLVNMQKTEFLEKLILISKHEYPLYLQVRCFLEAALNQF